ncbi:MAG: FAD-dependent oxidoreductase [Microbacterium pygmaeum]
MGTNLDPIQAPPLTDAQWARLVAFGTPVTVAEGDYLFRSGDREYDLILVETGEVEIVRDALRWMGEEVLAHMGPRSFVGELGLLNGQGAFLSARATQGGRMLRVTRTDLRRLMTEDDELSDIVLHALWARRESLRKGPAAMTLKFVGTRSSSDMLALRRFAERLDLVHKAVEFDPETATSIPGHDYTVEDLPIAYIQGEPILRATPGIVAERLGLSYQSQADEVVDLVVVGGGPAGLAAAIYGASEGLSTVLLDAVAPGGQAAATSRIENFLGFPFGVSGGDLIGQASLQALKFGVRVYAPCEAVRLEPHGTELDLTLSDGRIIRARTAVVTSGAAYRTLDLDRWEDFERAGIYYAATQLELRQVMEQPVVVVGGANSAGQASLYLAANGCPVRLIVRGDDLGTRMSSYLVDRLLEDPRVEVHTRSRVVGLEGGSALERVRIDTVGEVDARGLFCFIGADPATSWLSSLDRDADGFLRTGTDIAAQSLEQWQRLGREPLPFETSIPRVFAAGDVRRGSMKRVAAAVGEGSSAVASVHRALALAL